jgi:molybdenum cofactor cytidylyltransferase
MSDHGISPGGRGGARAAAIVLAAGGSRRMGRSKPLLDLGGRPLIAWHCERLAAFASPVIAVLGADADRVRAALPSLPGITAAHNPDWASTSPIDSLVRGLALLGSSGAMSPVLVTPVDVLPAEPETVAALLAAGGDAVPVGPDGDDGHPVLLSPQTAARIALAPPERGLREALLGAARVPVADPAVGRDFDDPAAFAVAARAWALRSA